jgi:hypothetical protein
MTKTIKLAIVGAAIALVCSAREAHATPNFPDEIRAHLTLAASPPCAICHQGGVTGLGTVTTPFGKSMRAHGLVPFDIGTLDRALDQMASQHVDSVGDGTPDIDDLKAGRDPNRPDGDGGIAFDEPLVPAYGCGARVAPQGDVGAFGAGAAVAAVLAILGMRKRR